MGVEVKEQLVEIILYSLLPPYNPRSHTQVTGFGGQLLYLLSSSLSIMISLVNLI